MCKLKQGNGQRAQQQAYPELDSSCGCRQDPRAPLLAQPLLGFVTAQRLKGWQVGLISALQVGPQAPALLPPPAGHQLVARVAGGDLVTQARPAPIGWAILVGVIGQGVDGASFAKQPASHHQMSPMLSPSNEVAGERGKGQG